MHHARARALRTRLDALLATRDPAEARAADPVKYVHRFADPADQEVVGFLASSLAFGNVVAVRASIERALAALGPAPARAIEGGESELTRALEGFVHRVYRGPHLARALAGLGALRREHGSVGERLAELTERHGFREGLAQLADAIRGGATAERGLRHLVPDPRAGSACKRLLLYCRWMTRPADGVDLGLWPLAPAALVMPVDTHVHRIAQNLGLTARKDASWRTAEEITAALRHLDGDDPVKYDFALCHLGVSRACPSRRDPDKCRACVLRPVCRQWKRPRGSA
ncbi:MAG: TIGR02757 family protein [Myxococcota bacterium]